jgi:hypothetical protein
MDVVDVAGRLDKTQVMADCLVASTELTFLRRLDAIKRTMLSSKDDVDNHSEGYPCITEGNGTCSLAFNKTHNGLIAEVHRFRPGSTLSYFIDENDLSPENVCKLREGMTKAASNWNQYNIGVTFQEVFKKKSATFRVVYNQNMGRGHYAVAFFPNAYHVYNKTIYVGPLSFQSENVNFISNVLCHELGHVLGIRHTKWASKEWDRPGGFYFPNFALDYLSVMNDDLAHTLSLFVISHQDAEDMKKLYRLPAGPHRGIYIIDV